MKLTREDIKKYGTEDEQKVLSEAGGLRSPLPQDIEVIYDGEYPNLCSGTLKIRIGKKLWDFGNHCLSSGGNVSFDDDWSEEVTTGEWDITEWPKNFPEELKEPVLNAVNAEIPWGCCGGCV